MADTATTRSRARPLNFGGFNPSVQQITYASQSSNAKPVQADSEEAERSARLRLGQMFRKSQQLNA